MKLESKVEFAAGLLMLAGLALGRFVDERWLLLAVFVGFNLLQSSISGLCGLKSLFKFMGARGANPSDSEKPKTP